MCVSVRSVKSILSSFFPKLFVYTLPPFHGAHTHTKRTIQLKLNKQKLSCMSDGGSQQCQIDTCSKFAPVPTLFLSRPLYANPYLTNQKSSPPAGPSASLLWVPWRGGLPQLPPQTKTRRRDEKID